MASIRFRKGRWSATFRKVRGGDAIEVVMCAFTKYEDRSMAKIVADQLEEIVCDAARNLSTTRKLHRETMTKLETLGQRMLDSREEFLDDDEDIVK